MRIFFKILLFPLSLLLSIVVAISAFLVGRFAVILNIFSGIMFFGTLAAYAQYFFGCPVGTAGNAPMLQLAILASVFAFLLSSGGLPTFTAWMVDKFDDLNCAKKSI